MTEDEAEKIPGYEYRDPKTGMVVKSVSPRHFWYCDRHNQNAVLIDLNVLEQFKPKFGQGHAYAQSLSELKYAARRLSQGKSANYSRVTTELAVLNKVGCGTGVITPDNN